MKFNKHFYARYSWTAALSLRLPHDTKFDTSVRDVDFRRDSYLCSGHSH